MHVGVHGDAGKAATEILYRLQTLNTSIVAHGNKDARLADMKK